jgi:hypothetical protein
MKNLSKNKLDKQKTEKIKITPIIKSLSGVIKLPKDYDYKKDYAEYLLKKYNSLK